MEKDRTTKAAGDRIVVTAPGPYPPVMVEGFNKRYAQLLQKNTASAMSELTSITQYIYHTWRLDERFSEIAKTMQKIAMVEMHHLDMLGQLIILLGGDPKYQARAGDYPVAWNGSMVTYSRTVARMMKDNIILEQAAIDTYGRQITQIQDKYVVAVLKRIVRSEERR